MDSPKPKRPQSIRITIIIIIKTVQCIQCCHAKRIEEGKELRRCEESWMIDFSRTTQADAKYLKDANTGVSLGRQEKSTKRAMRNRGAGALVDRAKVEMQDLANCPTQLITYEYEDKLVFDDIFQPPFCDSVGSTDIF
jgi:hypothetical protein